MPNVRIAIPSPLEPELGAAFERWQREWAGSITWGFATRQALRQFSARVSDEAFAAIPAGLTARTWPELAPHLALVARVRDVVQWRHGREERGTTRFAPGTLVYAHDAHSGDGYQRVSFTGRDRETGQWATMICDRRRFEDWHRAWIEDSELLFHLSSHGRYWSEDDLRTDLLAYVGAKAVDPAAFGWLPEHWTRLASSALVPRRERLPECVSIILGYDEHESRRVCAQTGHVGALFAEAVRAAGSASKDKLARPSVAWDLLAPPSDSANGERWFAKLPTLNGRAEASARAPWLARPDTLTAVVAWCSDFDGVLAAESLARRIAASLGASERLPIVWHIASRPLLIGWLRRPSDLALPDPELASQVAAMRSLLVELIDGTPQPGPAASGASSHAHALNEELVALGYALDAIGPDHMALLAPDLPVDARHKRQLRSTAQWSPER